MDVLYPKTLNEFIGQPQVTSQLTKIIAQASIPGQIFPHILLTSSPGMGKTALARVIANEMDYKMEELDLSQMTSKRLARILLQTERPLIFLDEIQRAKKEQQEMVLQWLSEGKLIMPDGFAENISYLSAIAATTREEKLDDALLDRFLIVEMQDYRSEDLKRILEAMADKLQVVIPEADIVRLADADLGSPRTGGKLVSAYQTLLHSEEVSVENVLKFLGREPDGLTPRHIRYMQALWENDGQLGQAPLSRITRMHQNILFEVEGALLKKKFITLTAQGRLLTSKGRERVKRGV